MQQWKLLLNGIIKYRYKMSLIKAISGISGTIGEKVALNLTPIGTVKFAVAYGMRLKNSNEKRKSNSYNSRDARISIKMVSSLVSNTLIGLGINVIDILFSTTPTVEVAVKLSNADGRIIITASHIQNNGIHYNY